MRSRTGTGTGTGASVAGARMVRQLVRGAVTAWADRIHTLVKSAAPGNGGQRLVDGGPFDPVL
ncbi:hypothetical protein [Streptomyces tendae]|uniref:hypothetical protein n=1 Tax=Streptomyces tendae TaxID=1932 RepID=UPI003D731BFC